MALIPGKSPSGTPPWISTWTDVTPGTAVTVVTTWESRASSVSESVPATKRAPRSIVATVPVWLTLSTGVPGRM